MKRLIFKYVYGMGDFVICFEANSVEAVLAIYPNLEHLSRWPDNWENEKIDKTKRKFTFKLDEQNPQSLLELLESVKPDQ